MCVLACRLELKGSQDKSIREFFYLSCVWGGAFDRVLIFILAEGLKIEFFGPIR